MIIRDIGYGIVALFLGGGASGAYGRFLFRGSPRQVLVGIVFEQEKIAGRDWQGGIQMERRRFFFFLFGLLFTEREVMLWAGRSFTTISFKLKIWYDGVIRSVPRIGIGRSLECPTGVQSVSLWRERIHQQIHQLTRAQLNPWAGHSLERVRDCFGAVLSFPSKFGSAATVDGQQKTSCWFVAGGRWLWARMFLRWMF